MLGYNFSSEHIYMPITRYTWFTDNLFCMRSHSCPFITGGKFLNHDLVFPPYFSCKNGYQKSRNYRQESVESGKPPVFVRHLEIEINIRVSSQFFLLVTLHVILWVNQMKSCLYYCMSVFSAQITLYSGSRSPGAGSEEITGVQVIL